MSPLFAPPPSDDPRFDPEQALGINWGRLGAETFFALVAGVTTALVLEIIREKRKTEAKPRHRALILEE